MKRQLLERGMHGGPEGLTIDAGVMRRCTHSPLHETRQQSGSALPSVNATVQERLATLGKELRLQAQDNERRLNEVLASVPPGELSTKIMQELFDMWAVHAEAPYDEHMARTGHDRAVELLIRQATALHSMGFGKDYEGLEGSKAKPRIFGSRILEMSCGTGTVIKLLCDNLAPADKEDITFIGNDLSNSMKAVARKKLEQHMRSIEYGHAGMGKAVAGFLGAIAGMHTTATKGTGLPRLIFTGEDLRSFHVRRRFDTAILSQTLHLIADPRKLPLEQASEDEPDEHRAVKIGVIRRAFERLPQGGHFLLIDEWPHLLTQGAGENLISTLFHRTFRPLRERSSIIDIMKHVQDACFVAELKVRIDARHSMYAMIYRKDDRQRIKENGHLPGHVESAGEPGRRVETARHRAMVRVYKAFEAVDPYFIKAYEQPGGETNGWVNFIPLASKDSADTLWCCESDIVHQQLQRAGPANAVVLSQVLHRFDEEGRKKLIGEAIGALKLGGALMFIEEWPPASDEPHNFRNRDFRSLMTDVFEGAMFEGAVRETILPGHDSGMYGYLYRKKEE